MITVRFWGVRGSVPAPISNARIEDKAVEIARKAWMQFRVREGHVSDDEFREFIRTLPFASRATYGGNTTCVEVRCDGDLIILDMGTGLRELGSSLMDETIQQKGLRGTILQSHVHWDHIQGYPFWAQVYMPRQYFDNRFTFYGGLDWNRSLEEVLRGQMNPPMFPVEHRELEQTGMRMDPHTVYDGKEIRIPHSKGGDIRVLCRKLNHPQETYGYRFEYRGQSAAFCTDHEPYAGGALHRPLVQLAKDVDVFITDCQYTCDDYVGAKGRVQKMGWGHSFPEYIAQIAEEARAKLVVTTHHDPEADEEKIEAIAAQVQEICGIKTTPAHEGLVITL